MGGMIMKKLGDVLRGVVGVLLLAGLAIVLSLALQGPAGEEPTSSAVASLPTSQGGAGMTTPTPLPDGLSVAPTPGGEDAWPKSTPNPAAVGKPIADDPSYTPPPPGEPEMYPIHTLDDVIAIALKDPFIQSRLESGCRRGSVPGTPVFVKYIGEDARDDWGYYLVPFYRENYIVLTAIVGTMGSQGASTGTIAECGCSSEAIAARAAKPRESPQDLLPVSADEAKRLVEKEGYDIEGEPRLVFRWLREGADEFDPFWKFRTADGETLYVIYRADDTRIYRATDVHSVH
jgi:hypothetical protein